MKARDEGFTSRKVHRTGFKGKTEHPVGNSPLSGWELTVEIYNVTVLILSLTSD